MGRQLRGPHALCGGDRAAHAPACGAGLHHRSEEHTSELQSHLNLVCRLLLEKKKNQQLALTRLPNPKRGAHALPTRATSAGHSYEQTNRTHANAHGTQENIAFTSHTRRPEPT